MVPLMIILVFLFENKKTITLADFVQIFVHLLEYRMTLFDSVGFILIR